mmetsp:Transcript_3963/g.8542  ORF Transcript_3963/g.8542 Transcript_3963/m.8542 type:complete len:93 (-) Transcript_3963:8-286(-)
MPAACFGSLNPCSSQCARRGQVLTSFAGFVLSLDQTPAEGNRSQQADGSRYAEARSWQGRAERTLEKSPGKPVLCDDGASDVRGVLSMWCVL